MDATRRARLALLLRSPRFRGSQVDLARALGLTEGRITQLLTEGSTFGERAARKYETKLELTDKWFDQAVDTNAVSEPEASYTPIRPPTLEEAIEALAEALWALDDDGRNMASTALSNLARNPKRADSTAKALGDLLVTYPREPSPDPTSPQPTTKAGKATAAAARTGKPRLTVKEGGGKKVQMSLPLTTVRDPWNDAQAPERELRWYKQLKTVPKANSG